MLRVTLQRVTISGLTVEWVKDPGPLDPDCKSWYHPRNNPNGDGEKIKNISSPGPYPISSYDQEWGNSALVMRLYERVFAWIFSKLSEFCLYLGIKKCLHSFRDIYTELWVDTKFPCSDLHEPLTLCIVYLFWHHFRIFMQLCQWIAKTAASELFIPI